MASTTVDQMEAEWRRASGEPAVSRPLLDARVAWLAAEPDPPPMTRWTAALAHAAVLLALQDPAADAALARADAWRPAALPAGHPLDALRDALPNATPAQLRHLGVGRL